MTQLANTATVIMNVKNAFILIMFTLMAVLKNVQNITMKSTLTELAALAILDAKYVMDHLSHNVLMIIFLTLLLLQTMRNCTQKSVVEDIKSQKLQLQRDIATLLVKLVWVENSLNV